MLALFVSLGKNLEKLLSYSNWLAFMTDLLPFLQEDAGISILLPARSLSNHSHQEFWSRLGPG